MERLLIDELILSDWKQSGKKLTYSKLAEIILQDEIAIPKMPGAKERPMSHGRKCDLIGAWNRGAMMSALRPRHIIRLAQHFNTNDITQLLSI